jgi:hypothetical protein
MALSAGVTVIACGCGAVAGSTGVITGAGGAAGSGGGAGGGGAAGLVASIFGLAAAGGGPELAQPLTTLTTTEQIQYDRVIRPMSMPPC